MKTPSTRLMISREKRDEKRDVQDQDAPHSKSAEEKEAAVPPLPPKRKLNCEHEVKRDVQDQDAPHSKSAEENEAAVPPIPPKRKLNCEHETSNKKTPPQCADLPSTHPSTLEDTNPHSVADASESTGGMLVYLYFVHNNKASLPQKSFLLPLK